MPEACFQHETRRRHKRNIEPSALSFLGASSTTYAGSPRRLARHAGGVPKTRARRSRMTSVGECGPLPTLWRHPGAACASRRSRAARGPRTNGNRPGPRQASQALSSWLRAWAQWLGEILPLTHYLRIVRGIMLKGATFFDLGSEALWLIGLTLVAMTIAVTRFRRTLD